MLNFRKKKKKMEEIKKKPAPFIKKKKKKWKNLKTTQHLLYSLDGII